MILKLDDDFSDEIVVANLAMTYVNLKGYLKNGRGWHKDDIETWKKLLPALEVVGGWYCTDFKQEIKKAKKQNESEN